MNYGSKDVTVIIPVFNAEKTVLNTLDSLLNQKEKDFKLIIINDGSKDKSFEICSDWKKNHPSMDTFILDKQNEGVSKARNDGIKLAETPLVAFLDSDDEWEKDKLKKQIAFFNENQNAVLLGTGSNLRKITGNTVRIRMKDLCKRNLFVTSSVVCKTEVLKEFYFDETLSRSEDFNLWIKITSKYDESYVLNELLTFYDKSSDGLSSENRLSKNHFQFEKDELKSFKKLYEEKYLSFFQFLFIESFSLLKYFRRLLKKR